MIKLKNELHPELLQLGLKSGDVIRDHTKPAKNGAVYFNVNYNGFTQSCVVWPDNYEVLGEQVERNDSKINKRLILQCDRAPLFSNVKNATKLKNRLSNI